MEHMENVRAEIVPLIRDVCMRLTGHANDHEVALLLGTAAAESSLIHRKQIGGGPARGLWQMERATGYDIFKTYLNRKRILFKRLTRLWLELSSLDRWYPTPLEIGYHLEHFDDFACAMARVKYLRDPDPIPDTVEGQAAYWKKIYNTPAGKGTIEHYLSQWESCGCESLLEVWMDDDQKAVVAAGPEMLDVLSELEGHISDTEGAYPPDKMVLMLDKSLFQRVHDAIAKARGGE